MSIKITGTFTPSGNFGLVDDIDLIGGYKTVETLEERDNLPILKRKFGMLVYVKDENKIYKLVDKNGDLSDNNNWEEYQNGQTYYFENGLNLQPDNYVKFGGRLIENTKLVFNQDVELRFENEDQSFVFSLNEQNKSFAFKGEETNFESKIFYITGIENKYQPNQYGEFYDLVLNSDTGEIRHTKYHFPKYIKRYSRRTGANFVQNYNGIDFGFYMYANKSYVKLYKNGELINPSEWDFWFGDGMALGEGMTGSYSTKIYFKNIFPVNSDDVFEIVYNEPVIPGIYFDLRAIRHTNQIEGKRDTLTVPYTSINGYKYYLDSVITYDVFTIDATYIRLSNPSVSVVIKKRYANSITLAEFNLDEQLPFYVELWSEAKSCNWNFKHSQGRKPKMHRGHIIPTFAFNRNLFVFNPYWSRSRYDNIYYVRFRFQDAVGGVYFSEFMPYKVSMRTFPMINPKTKEFLDIYKNIKIIY